MLHTNRPIGLKCYEALCSGHLFGGYCSSLAIPVLNGKKMVELKCASFVVSNSLIQQKNLFNKKKPWPYTCFIIKFLNKLLRLLFKTPFGSVTAT